MVGSTRYGPVVLVATMLVLGGVYLVATLSADRPTDTKLFPVACGAVFVALLLWEGVAMLVKRRSVAEPSSSAAGEMPPDPAKAAVPAEAARPEDAGTARRRNAVTFLGLTVSTGLFAYVATQVDYLLGTAVFMVAAMWLIGEARRSWTLIAAVAALSVVAVNLIFVQVLSVRLPSLIPGL